MSWDHHDARKCVACHDFREIYESATFMLKRDGVREFKTFDVEMVEARFKDGSGQRYTVTFPRFDCFLRNRSYAELRELRMKGAA